MRLIGEAVEFDLNVVGYQYPDVKSDPWDSEWLLVLGRISCAQGSWTFRDPCLCTFEVKRLATWLRDVRAGGPGGEVGFTEPNLRFEHVEQPTGDVLVVAFSQESAPPWASDDERYGDGFHLAFPFAANDFNTAATSLDQMSERYPIRTRPRDTG